MDPAAVAGLCALLAQGKVVAALPETVSCPPIAAAKSVLSGEPLGTGLASEVRSPTARAAIARVAYAEAANQGDSGLAAVIYTILNRLQDGRWGETVDAVLNAHAQFEPVLRAGGDWRALPPVSAVAQARIDTILNLALEGRLPDLTHGARFFQNPMIVAARVRSGQAPSVLLNFGGARPTAVIGAHSFYAGTGGGGPSAFGIRGSFANRRETSIFVGENRVIPPTHPVVEEGRMSVPAPVPSVPAGDTSQALFVSSTGRITATQP